MNFLQTVRYNGHFSFKPISQSEKKCKLVSLLKVVRQNNVIYCCKMVETTFSTFGDSFSLITPNLQRICAWSFTHKAF